MPKFEKVNPEGSTEPEIAPQIAVEESKTNAQLIDELAALEVEQKRQEIEYRKMDMIVKKDQVAKIKAEYDSKLEAFRMKNQSTLNLLAQRASQQANCNHRKGGRGAEGVMRGQGDDAMYAVIKHKMPINDFMVLCTRCGKEWQPANRWNTENGKLVPLAATPGWAEAVQWPTDNSPSGSGIFTFEKVSV